MAKLIIKHGMTEMSIEGTEAFINHQKKMFWDLLAVQGDTSKLPPKCQTERIAVEEYQNRPRTPSWAELKQAANEGKLSELAKSGDRLPLVLKNGEKVDLDVGRDEAGRTYFVFHHSMKSKRRMNQNLTNTGGWRDCEMRRYANEDVYNLLPEEAKEVVASTRIVQVIDGEHIETHDKLFCLSAAQVFGKDGNWDKKEPDNTQIDIFRDPRARIKSQVGRDETYGTWWWLRSTINSYYFNYVNRDGNYYSSGADNSGAVVLSFCIEESE